MEKKKPQILINSKNVIGNKRLIQALQNMYQIKIFDDHHHLKDLISKDSYRLIIWELSDTETRVYNTIKFIKKKYSHIKIIVLINGTNIKMTAEILKAGASDVFPKPFELELLFDRIVALMS